MAALPTLPSLPPKPATPSPSPAVPRILPQPESAVQRATASTINRVDTNPTKQVTLSGIGKRGQVAYGEVRTSGFYIAGPVLFGGNLIFAIFWSWGHCEGVQAIYINEADLPLSGVTMTHYSGAPGQTPDPTLVAAIPGFEDAFENIAYTVFELDAAVSIVGWPRVEAIFRGRIIEDPRTGIEAWTENPSLFIYDFVRNSSYGPGLGVKGAEACADFNDSDYFGVPRARAGYVLSEGDTLPDVLGVMSAYADCLWHYDGSEVRLIPDTIVEAPAVVLERGDIIGNTMRIRTVNTSQTPTTVAVNYLQESGGPGAWTPKVMRQALPGVSSGDLEEIESSVNFPGVRRELEAARKGSVRLNRLRFSGKYSWRAPDSGLRFQKGDVVQLPNHWGLTNQLVRVMDAQVVELGRYQIEAEHYDPAMYHDQVLPETPDSPVYEGLIFPYSGLDMPEGWEEFTAANGKYLKGADGVSIAIGATGGEATVSGWSGVTNGANMHQGSEVSYQAFATSSEADGSMQRIGGSAESNSTFHAHDVEVSEFTPDLYRRDARLIKKVGGNAELLPPDALALGVAGIVGLLSQRTSIYAGRLLRAGAVPQNGGVQNISAADYAVVLPGGVSHRHGSDETRPFIRESGTRTVYNHTGAGTHTHTVGALSVRMKRQAVAVYGAINESGFGIRPGMFAFVDDPALLADLPPDWYLCDGTNGTVNIVDYYLELAGDGDLPGAQGDNTLAILGNTSSSSHGHRGMAINTNSGSTTQRHQSATHAHVLNIVKSWQPEWYALPVIQYLPEG